MIKENQKLLNNINVLSDAAIHLAALPIAFWIRFFVMTGGVVSVPFHNYIVWDIILVITHLFTYASLGIYRSFRQKRLWDELKKIWLAGVINIVLMIAILFIQRNFHYSRWVFVLYFVISLGALSIKRFILRRTLRHFRERGYNSKHVLILGNGTMAKKYIEILIFAGYRLNVLVK